MKDKTFLRLLAAVAIIGVLSTTGLVLYTVHLHDTCSILAFISNEGR